MRRAAIFLSVMVLASLAVYPAESQPRLTPAQQEKLNALVVEHRSTRARLPIDQRNTLDRLTALVRKTLVERKSQSGIYQVTSGYVSQQVTGLTKEEVATITDYVLGGIAASDPIGPATGGSSEKDLLNATKQMQETQMSFNLQYLQLQSQMQSENRSYTAISNIMKTKHDTVKNSISNIR